MRIVVTAAGPGLEDRVDPRFGRCPYFLVVDPDTMQFEALENPNLSAAHGAGIQSAQLVAEQGADSVLTGNCGPNAFRTLEVCPTEAISVNGVASVSVEDCIGCGHCVMECPERALSLGPA